jgi:hypothetical protein
MAEIVTFPHVDGAAASSSTTFGMSRAELRDTAWTNFYRAERRQGVAPDLAYQRADEHAKRFDQILENIGQLISEVG